MQTYYKWLHKNIASQVYTGEYLFFNNQWSRYFLAHSMILYDKKRDLKKLQKCFEMTFVWHSIDGGSHQGWHTFFTYHNNSHEIAKFWKPWVSKLPEFVFLGKQTFFCLDHFGGKQQWKYFGLLIYWSVTLWKSPADI